MEEAAKKAFGFAPQAFGHLVSGLREIKWDEHIKGHIKKNPKMSAFQIVMIVMAVVQGLVIAPVLGLLGFGSLGPVAGGAAAAFQSANGATAGFSILQSAAMGGTAVFGNVVTGVCAGVGVVTEFFKRRGGA
ncbi:hypothetical protein LTR91_011883 [Friedmanniomyces endolithicus]|uniref:Uncharacterized protein n=1 Tax=Friedmanniomyces endolithicus TaxID=329885 RepID=A0AAN6KGF6_9PEZI|nr:hypothetical protein LTR94_006829 [Friedmanniomyces endolithicus]KAK0782716.1 hypothetical protein LTR59_012058 [Friedmanniomyces endolithicus]KAK0789574.1 hypothetical protein LTR38_010890 [Friedmanniomyces endolithicus]KAK0816735.1 hypothetical protein LTR75_003418 [Friedmanniomyces endolithicus]KAK0847188.1 hypothetical protein LTS02_014590 [Friedmanniomyces endolithicus]